MKIEQLLVQYLYNNKQVSLQGIGIFKLNPDVILPVEGDKDFSMPADAFSFEYNLKASEDEGLVDYIVQQTRKIKPLASSDLESYAILAKQFLNIGKPLLIEGVGTIQKSQQGEYEFLSGQFITPKIDEFPVQLKERKDETVSFESESVPVNKSRNLLILLTIVGIILAGLALYYFLVLKNPKNIQQGEQTVSLQQDTIKNDTLRNLPPVTDTTIKAGIDSAVNLVTPSGQLKQTEGSSFKIVLKEYTTQTSAQKAYDRLTTYGHKVEIIKIDSTRYKLVMPFTKPLADTLRVKDSLKRFFGGSPYIQLQ